MKIQLFLTIIVLNSVLSFSQKSQEVSLIDLGLPSGLQWMEQNLGANKSYEFGEYYLGNDTPTLTDLGEGFSIPSKVQFQELIDHTVHRWTEIEGVEGMIFTASNGNNIFLPAAAQLWWNNEKGAGYWDINNRGSGAYWTSTPSSSNYIYFLEFNDEEGDRPFFGDRKKSTNRLPIRPVFDIKLAGVSFNLSQPEEIKIKTTGNSIFFECTIESQVINYSLLSISGETIITGKTIKGTSLNNLERGIYILNLVTSSQSKSLKIII